METRPDKDELTGLLERTLLQTRFDAGRYGAFSAEQMRSMHEQGTLILDPRAPLIQTVVADEALTELSEKLGQVMLRVRHIRRGSEMRVSVVTSLGTEG